MQSICSSVRIIGFELVLVGKWCGVVGVNERLAQLRNYSDEYFQAKDITEDFQSQQQTIFILNETLRLHGATYIFSLFRKREIYFVIIYVLDIGYHIQYQWIQCSLHAWFYLWFDVTLALQFHVLIVGDYQKAFGDMAGANITSSTFYTYRKAHIANKFPKQNVTIMCTMFNQTDCRHRLFSVCIFICPSDNCDLRSNNHFKLHVNIIIAIESILFHLEWRWTISYQWFFFSLSTISFGLRSSTITFSCLTSKVLQLKWIIGFCDYHILYYAIRWGRKWPKLQLKQ